MFFKESKSKRFKPRISMFSSDGHFFHQSRFILVESHLSYISYQDFSFFSFGGHFVYRSNNILAIFPGSHLGNIPEKFESHWPKGSRGDSI